MNNVNGKAAGVPSQEAIPDHLMTRAEAQAIMNELVVQKNMVTDRCVSLSVQLQQAQKQIEDLKAQLVSVGDELEKASSVKAAEEVKPVSDEKRPGSRDRSAQKPA